MLIRSDEVETKSVERARGGAGTILGQALLGEHPGSSIKGLGITRLPPGTSVGFHEHHGEEDFYFCLSGEGIVLDHDEEKPFLPGTLQITRSGQAQAIRNTGPTDLVFFGGLITCPPQS
jgi:mannose-6-phosphate isomerase-like protein (cupin superfamily)